MTYLIFKIFSENRVHQGQAVAT